MLVSTETLAAHLGDPDWIVFDTRHDLAWPDKGRQAWEASHIPGAHFMHLDHDLSGKKTGKNGRHPLPPLADFAALMNRCGVAPGRQVVVYDDGGGSFAVRLWWMLWWLGHDKVALLDGGIAAWKRESRPMDALLPAAREGRFEPRPSEGMTVDANTVAASLDKRDLVVVDARAATRYMGENETLDPVAGHIPGSFNRFWQHNLGYDGRFLSPEELRAEFLEEIGEVDPKRVVHSCGSGVTACHNLFAMELAGLSGSRLYPGSWSEWCADPSRPVATGPK
ncbi:MAG: sulfurtransferase [Betaproteobacteria bacterium]|nr:sulfurtransferase [Betaproteobacteria bacterium]PWB64892.1 MAG: sulfurtransferase [Betaproteobacteria bacterium]